VRECNRQVDEVRYGRHESLNVKALLNLETGSRSECKCAYVSV
jgi:hypothetical protein